jgi:hypothetical protein
VTFRFTYNAEDYWAAQKLFILKRQLAGKKRITLIVSEALFLLMAALTAATGQWGIATFFFVFGMSFVWLPLWLKWNYRKEFAKQKSLHFPLDIELSHDGYRTKNELGEGHARWEMFDAWLEDESLFMLLPKTPRLFYMLPKRSLSTEEQAAIRELLSASIKP